MTAPLPHPIQGTPVIWARNPFGIGDRDIYRDVRTNSGETIMETLESVPGLPWRRFQKFGVVVLTDGLNEVIIPRENWRKVRPRQDRDVAIFLKIPLQGGGGGGSGGGGGKNILGTLAAIALLAVVTVASGGFGAGLGAGAWFAAGSQSARLLALGISVIGGLALTALTPPPVSPKATSGNVEERDGTASASGNILQRGAVIPRPIGTIKMFPPFAQQPLVEIIDGEERVECILALSGPCKLDDIRIAGAPLEESEDLQFETREGWATSQDPAIDDDQALTLVTRQARQESPQIELSNYLVDPNDADLLKDSGNPDRCVPVWHSVGTRNSPDEIWLDFAFPEGLTDSDDPDNYVLLPLRFRMRVRGSSTWSDLPELIAVGRKPRRDKMLSVRIIWGTVPDIIPTPPINKGFKYAYKGVAGQSMAPTTSNWNAHSHFSAGSGNNVLSSDTLGSTNVRNVELREDRAIFYLSEETFPKGIYEIEVKRGGAMLQSDFVASTHQYSGDTRDVFHWRQESDGPTIPADVENRTVTTILNRVASIWNEYPIGKPGLALIAITGRARRLEQISTVAGGYVPDYDPNTGEWSNWSVPDHPAAAYRWMHVGSLNADPMPEELLRDSNLLDWRSRCIAKGYSCHMIADGDSLSEIRQTVASCGYARPRQSERWGVIQDRDRRNEGPAQTFNPRNLSAFRWEKAFVKMPHGFLIKFRNAEIDFEEDEVIVYAPGYDVTNATRLEEVTYDGLAYKADVEKRGNFDLRQARERMTFHYGEADIESLGCERGDLIEVQHEILERKSGHARIRMPILDEDTGLTIGMDLDSKIQVNTVPDFSVLDIPHVLELDSVLTQSWRTGIQVRLKDGTAMVREIYAEDEESDEVYFKLPFFDPGTVTLRGEVVDLLGQDCLISSGPLGEETGRYILADIVPGENETASLVFVDEAPGLFDQGQKGAGAASLLLSGEGHGKVMQSGSGSADIDLTGEGGAGVGIGGDGAAEIDTGASGSGKVMQRGSGSAELALSASGIAKVMKTGAGTAELVLTVHDSEAGAFDISFDSSFG